MDDRDMMYGGYYQNMPGNIGYGGFEFQGLPGSLTGGCMMMPNMMNMNNVNPLVEINSRLTSLENRVRIIEQRLGNSNNSYQDDNSMYMI